MVMSCRLGTGAAGLDSVDSALTGTGTAGVRPQGCAALLTYQQSGSVGKKGTVNGHFLFQVRVVCNHSTVASDLQDLHRIPNQQRTVLKRLGMKNQQQM